jgi:chorismate mutase/prephenate dehydratase
VSELADLRRDINEIDNELMVLLAKRRRISHLVAEAKIKQNKPVRDIKREEMMLVELINGGKSLGLDGYYVKQVFQVIIEDSVLHQQALLQKHTNKANSSLPINRVAYLGSQGSYSDLATQKYFSRHPSELKQIGCTSFNEIIQKVEQGHADHGILPIENTSSGSINEVYDLLQHTSLSIVGELTHPVNHCMVTAVDTTPDKIRKIYAHPQVHTQCSHYLSQFPNLEVEFCEASSAAFDAVRDDETGEVAALGSGEGARLYGLHVIAEALANQKENFSRFIVLAQQSIDVSEQIPAKTTWIMSTEQKPGALVDALLILKEHGLSMTKLESRPITGNPWEEMFYVDVDGNSKDERVKQALNELKESTRYLKVLGCYPSEDVQPAQVETN